MKKETKKYILYLESDAEFHAGTKATEDCAVTLEKRGYERLQISCDKNKNKLILNFKKIVKHLKLFRIQKNSILVIQHPQYMRSIYIRLIESVKKNRKCKIVCIIHDIESLRKVFKGQEEAYKKMDNLTFEIADILIAHNDSMKKYLVEKRGVCEDKIVVLGLFDYLTDAAASKSERKAKRGDGVIVAGNLDRVKSGYVHQLVDADLKTRINLYGVNWIHDHTGEGNWSYKGAFKPEELPACMEGAFGLVWDGGSIMTCDGPTGRYVQYNNPHKVSLYAASGIPIIIWEKAALADFVVRNNVGIAVGDLRKLDEAISDITEEEYQEMRDNILKLSEKVRSGFYIQKAIMSAENILIQRER
ncbi:MAG: hypothetical protein PHX08_21975 [Lachnospiraceae bacterium]|nr:hypothetical protein [Lachnospiraceae bacterium]